MTKLRNRFSCLRSREEIYEEIQSKEALRLIYEGWNEEQQAHFLDICSGEKGIKILYDGVFKEIFNPDAVPERLEELLSLLLEEKVKILKVLPNDSRLGDESALIIMDIVVELENGSIANVECQKIGYAFPGQRAACYSADLLLRQYKRVRGERGVKFSYKDIKKVYNIVFFEKSPAIFHRFPDAKIHRSKQRTDTGLEMELLQEYLFIPVDILQENDENISVKTKLDAWLMFLASDQPEAIIRLLDAYPEFEPLYEELYRLCQNTERIMHMFSEELYELDKNTVQYMIDEMQDEIDAQKVELEAKDAALQEQTNLLQEQGNYIAEQGAKLEAKDNYIAELEAKLRQLQKI